MIPPNTNKGPSIEELKKVLKATVPNKKRRREEIFKELRPTVIEELARGLSRKDIITALKNAGFVISAVTFDRLLGIQKLPTPANGEQK